MTPAENRRCLRIRRDCYRRAREAVRRARAERRLGSSPAVAMRLSEARTWRELGSAWLAAARAWESSNSDHLSSENASLSSQVESMAMRIESLAEELAKPEDARLREVLDALEGRAVIFDGLGARVGHVLDEMDEWIGRAGEAERTVDAARRRLACVADDMTEHAYQELASALESPPRIAGKTAGFDQGTLRSRARARPCDHHACQLADRRVRR